MCVCVIVIRFILDVRLVHVPAGVTQEEGHKGFLRLPSAMLASIFLARRFQPFLSLVDREVEFCVLTNQSFSTPWAFFFFFVRKKPLVRFFLPEGVFPPCDNGLDFFTSAYVRIQSNNQSISGVNLYLPGV